MSESDHELMHRIGRGDASAFEKLVCRWEHPVYRVFYPLAGVRCYTGADESNVSTEHTPLRGIAIDGRTAVILSPRALTCGWTRRSSCIRSCRRIATEDAFKLAVNIILYALTH